VCIEGGVRWKVLGRAELLNSEVGAAEEEKEDYGGICDSGKGTELDRIVN
jgi:hypothetical protein